MRLPDLSALNVRERRREEYEIEAPLVPSVIPYLDLAPWREWAEALYPYESFDTPRSESEPLTPTSKLWEERLLNTSEIMKDWNHINRLEEISYFFEEAEKSGVDTLAHVVLVRKQYDDTDIYPNACKSTTGINSCYHGHIAVVLEPVFQPSAGKPRDVVSLGFFPRGGDARNLIPGYVGDGALQTPDAMVRDWRNSLAQGRRDAKMEDHVAILETFLYPPEKMGRWKAVVQERMQSLGIYGTLRSLKSRATNNDKQITDVEYGKFDFYSGMNMRRTSAYIIQSMSHKLSAMTSLIMELDYELGKMDRAGNAFNCATWMLAAFPEANMICPGGVPRLCMRKGGIFQPLESGMSAMIESANAALTQIVGRTNSVDSDEDDLPELDQL